MGSMHGGIEILEIDTIADDLDAFGAGTRTCSELAGFGLGNQEREIRSLRQR